jgi:hypothetical protein
MARALRVLLLGEPVVDSFVAPAMRDDAGGAQDAEVARRIRLRQVEGLFDVADAELAMREERDDSQAHVIAEGLEQA